MIERIGIMREPELSLLFRSGRPPAFTVATTTEKDKSARQAVFAS